MTGLEPKSKTLREPLLLPASSASAATEHAQLATQDVYHSSQEPLSVEYGGVAGEEGGGARTSGGMTVVELHTHDDQ